MLIRTGLLHCLIFLVAVLPAQTSHSQEGRYVTDKRSGVKLALPLSMLKNIRRTQYGLNFRNRGRLNIDTLKYPPSRTLTDILEKLRTVRGRRIDADVQYGDGFRLEGRDRNRTRFIVQIEQQNSEIRGVSIVYSRRGGRRLQRLARKILGTVDLFPERGGESNRTAASTQEAGPQSPLGSLERPSKRQNQIAGTSPQSRLKAAVSCHLDSKEASASLRAKLSVRAGVKQTRRIGEATSLSWSINRKPNSACRTPLYLVVSTHKRTRFGGEGFLAIPKGQVGPFEIRFNLDKNRLFFPLHLLDQTKGAFQVKSFKTGSLNLEWSLIEVPRIVANPQTRRDFALGQELATKRKSLIQAPFYQPGKPRVQVLNDRELTKPQRIIRANSGEFDLLIYRKHYRVVDTKTGEVVLERPGVDPNFSPGARFVSAFAESGNSILAVPGLSAPSIEVLDLYSGNLVNVGKSLFLAWGHGDALMSPGLNGCVGNSCSTDMKLYQTLVDRPAIDLPLDTYKTAPTGLSLFVDLETGIAAAEGYRGDGYHDGRRAWASLFRPGINSHRVAKREKPNCNRGNKGVIGRREALCYKKLGSVIDNNYRTVAAAARVPRAALYKPAAERNSSDLGWYVQSKSVVLSQHCLRGADGNCPSWRPNLASIRIQHGKVRVADGHVYSTRSRLNGRMVTSRLSLARSTSASAVRSTTLDRIEELLSRTQNVSIEETARAKAVDFEKLRRRSKQLGNWAKAVKELVSRQSRSAAALLPSGKLDAETENLVSSCLSGGGRKTDKLSRRRPLYMNHVSDILFWQDKSSKNWLLRTECDYGASRLFMGWLLTDRKGKPAQLIDLSFQLRHTLAGAIQRYGPPAEALRRESRVYRDWPQTIDQVKVTPSGVVLASGRWPGGLWALAYDTAKRKPIAFIDNVEGADTFDGLEVTSDRKFLLQTNSDGQLFLYNPVTAKVLLRGLSKDDEIVLHDDDGRYFATAEGAHFVRIKFPGVPGSYSFQQFEKKLRVPDLLQRLRQREEIPQDNVQVPPSLSVKFENSENGPKRIRGSFRKGDFGSLTEVRVYQDGVQTDAIQPTSADGATNFDVHRLQGARWISLIGVNAQGIASQPVSLDLGRDPRGQSRLLSVAIGITDYKHDDVLADIFGAANDAGSIDKALRSLRPKQTVGRRLLVDSRATRTAVLRAIEAAVAEAREGDTLLISFAGHGVKDRDGAFYLTTHDTRFNELRGTGIAWQEISSLLRGSKARVVVLLDACHSGAAGTEFFATNDDAADQLLAGIPSNVIIFAAAKGREYSFATLDKMNGEFTRAVAEVIADERTDHDLNANGAIEISELFVGVKRKVVLGGRAARAAEARESSSKFVGTQTPWIARNNMIGDFALF